MTNCVGPVFSQFAHGADAGSASERLFFKISDQLVLAVPKANLPSAASIDREPKQCTNIGDLPLAHFLAFVISGDWSGSYRPEEVPMVGGRRQFKPDVVGVRIEPERPSPFSAEEQQMIAQTGREEEQQDSLGSRQIGAMSCLVPKPPLEFLFCSGHRSAADPDLVKLRYRDDYPGTRFILLQADYTSTRHGGVHVYWQTWTLDASRALDIDAAIWKSIEDWNLRSPATEERH